MKSNEKINITRNREIISKESLEYSHSDYD